MLGAKTPAHVRREKFRELLAGDKLVQFPGAINPINAQLIEQAGFEGATFPVVRSRQPRGCLTLG